MKLTIIIPVYNEENTIVEVIKRVNVVSLPNRIIREIIVVDDASNDSSKLKVESLKQKNLRLFVHHKNRGKGAAIRTGLKHATGDILLIQDADLEYSPDDYSRLLAPILAGNTEVVYGTRLKDLQFGLIGRSKTPFATHYLGNRFLSIITSILYGTLVTDMETCYKAMTRKVYKSLKLKSNRFEIEPEITAKILKAGYKIHEVPIKVSPRGYNEGKKITWKDGFIALWTLIKYRFSD